MRAISPRSGRLGLLALGIVILVLALLWISGGAERAPTATDTPAPEPTLSYPTVLPTPADLGEASFFPENDMANFAYCAECYPHIAALYPPETPCATWQNGGLQWFNLDHLEEATMKLGWGAVIWQGPHQFCGFPQPYPEKPATPPDPEDLPDEWLGWMIEATENAPAAVATATEVP